jgi:uncharacterized protein (TIGR01777 family)
MNILISGSTGLVGSSLLRPLGSKGHTIKTLVRHSPTHPSQIRWNPPVSGPLPEALDGVDAVIHLAGESIASGRWTETKKRAIRDSRVMGTRILCEVLSRMKRPPKVLLSASAIGYYGDRGQEIMKEENPAGAGFLADVCKEWEAASAPAVHAGIRVVHLRFGIILSPRGGALAKMLLPFRLGAGGILGSGTQYMSWIALDDVLGILPFALETESLRGPINVVSPKAVTNLEYTKTLGRILSRPTIFPMPAFAARLAFGEMADALLLSSTRVEPAALLKAGYPFQWADLENALRHLLTK